MKTKRKNLSPRVLAAENSAITQFLFDRTSPFQDGKIPLQRVFDCYQAWRAKNAMPPTALTIDGFGRLFPHAYPRKSAYWAPAGHALKCVFGLELTS